MAVQDILPITSIAFVIIGFIIILVGFIWLANLMSKVESHARVSYTEELFEEMNQMFSYFTDQIDHKTQKDHKIQKEDDLENENVTKVLNLHNKGKTPDQIAKALNMGKGEVNLILGIDQMR